MAGEARRRRLRALLAQANVTAFDVKAIEAAFVHESAVREKRGAHSNERLEFLGDAILGFAVARSLFERYPDASEGELALRKSALVSDAALAATAERLDFEPLLVMGKGLANLPRARRRALLSDAFEAFLAALYRASGFDVMAAFVERVHIDEHAKSGASIDDPKTVLQEWSQRHYAAVPVYTERFEGPDHERTFFADVAIAGEVLAAGTGPNKKEAQRAAAALALERLRERHTDLAPRKLSAAKAPKRRVRARPRRATDGSA